MCVLIEMIIGFFKKKEEEEDTNGGGWVLAMKRRNGRITNEGWWTCGVVWKMLIQGYNERGGMVGLLCISLIMLESGRNGTGGKMCGLVNRNDHRLVQEEEEEEGC